MEIITAERLDPTNLTSCLNEEVLMCLLQLFVLAQFLSLIYYLLCVICCGVDYIPGIFRSTIWMCWDVPASFWRSWRTSTGQPWYWGQGRSLQGRERWEHHADHKHPTGQLLSFFFFLIYIRRYLYFCNYRQRLPLLRIKRVKKT